MEEVSKKDLLKITGISYGQLYRWKRLGLIPEDWFVKRASFTGQETYFPKDLILDRIDKILELKDDVSLEELSEIINNHKLKTSLHKSDLVNRNILLNVKLLEYIQNETIDFNELVILKILDHITNQSFNLKNLFDYLMNHKDDIVNFELIYLLINQNEIGCILTKEANNLEFNISGNIKINIKNLIEHLKLIII